MRLDVQQYLYNVIVPDGTDGMSAFSEVITYLKDLLNKKEISSYSISPVVQTRHQFDNQQYFSRILNITVDGDTNAIAIDFHLFGVVYTLGILDEEEGIQRSLDDFGNTIRSVADLEWLASFNKNIGIFYTLYKDMVGE